MDYEKKYKEALEWARKVMQGKVGFVLDDVLEKFPELKESEGERIRKELISFVRDMLACHDKPNVERDEKYESWIAWLEKQGEQKPVEWSKKDEQISNAIVEYLGGSDALSVDLQSARCWVENVKDRVRPQPKQEWSGGDEAHLYSLITHLQQWIERHPNTTGADVQGENITWLKSLKDRVGCETNCTTTWKPSDEQMNALKEACDEHWELILNTLYQDLKKLKG